MIASLVACAHTRARAVAVCALVADARSTTWLCRSMPTAPCTRRDVCDSNWLLSVDGPLPPPQLSPRGGSFPTPFQRRACRRAAAVAALNNGLLRLGAKMQNASATRRAKAEPRNRCIGKGSDRRPAAPSRRRSLDAKLSNARSMHSPPCSVRRVALFANRPFGPSPTVLAHRERRAAVIWTQGVEGG
jgi:hypothetical protein